MYIVTLTYKVSLEEMYKHLEAHREYLKKHFELGHFIASGPQKPRTGGIIIASATDKSELDAILNEDPFKQNEVADYAVIEFEATMTCAELKSYKIEISS